MTNSQLLKQYLEGSSAAFAELPPDPVWIKPHAATCSAEKSDYCGMNLSGMSISTILSGMSYNAAGAWTMPQDSTTPTQKRKIVGKFTDHVRTMPAWHKRLLWFAIGLTLIGATAQVAGHFSRNQQDNEATSSEKLSPESRSLVSADSQPAKTADEPPATWSQWLSKGATTVGISFVAGFVIGWIFRAFLKTMLLVTVLGVGLLIALSWFNVLNVDFSKAREQYETGMQWVSDQGSKLKDAAMGHIPTSLPALFGGFVGFRRK